MHVYRIASLGWTFPPAMLVCYRKHTGCETEDVKYIVSSGFHNGCCRANLYCEHERNNAEFGFDIFSAS